ncbi:MAG: hypothetical protein EOO40_10235, partial [Deltaproteobacteria bacterium]
MSGLPNVSNNEKNTIQKWSNQQGPTVGQQQVAHAAQDVLAKQYAANEALKTLAKDSAAGAGSLTLKVDQDTVNTRMSELRSTEITFWTNKVGEDQSWVQSGGGTDASSALSDDQQALAKLTANTDAIDEGSISAIVKDNSSTSAATAGRSDGSFGVIRAGMSIEPAVAALVDELSFTMALMLP